MLNSYHHLPPSAVEKLKKRFEIEMIYNSNAIEGNSLTLEETYLVINEGIAIKGKPLKDHLEAKSHQKALSYLYELAEKNKRSTVSETLIRSLNQIIIHDADKEWAGKYRNSLILIVGADYQPPEAIEVPLLMQNLIKWIKHNQSKLHPIELAGIVHHKLVSIHPFFDGNGRTSRLVMNIILMQIGFPLVVILKNDRSKYYRFLAQADQGDYKPFVRFIAQAAERSLDIYLKFLTPKNKVKEKFIFLSELSKKTKFTEKYLNVLVRSGKLEAHKESRNWLSSVEALTKYLNGRERKRK